MSKMDSFFDLSPLNTTVSRKVISFSDISAVNLMVGWNLEFVENVVTSAKTRNSSLFSRIFFFSIVRRTCRKKRRGDQSEVEAKWLAQQSLPFQTRGEIDQASKWTNERAWGKQNHFAPLIPFAKARGGRGREFTSFAPNYSRPFLTVFPLRSRFYLSVSATQASKTKQNFFSVN